MRSIPASDWIANYEAQWEAKYGSPEIVNTVEEPEDIQYPMVFKKCAVCGRQSERRRPDNGYAFICTSTPECRATRSRITMSRSRAQ